jgi:hypothetical protein
MRFSRVDRRNVMKCIEELSELSVELLHAINKPNKENMGKICNEIKDVEKYINLVKILCDD